jgi:hypothetical protein
VSGARKRLEGKPPNPELVALHERVFDAFNRRDWEGMFSLQTDDIAVRSDPRWPGGGEFRGREEIMRFMDQFLEPWEEIRYQAVSNPIEVNGRLVERGSWVGSGRSSGIPGTVEFTVVTSPRAGRMARMDVFLSHKDAVDYARSEPLS